MSAAIPSAGPHGGDGAAVAAALGIAPADLLDLSMSLNPAAPDIRTMVVRHLDELGRYPDDGHANWAMAETLGLDVDHLVLTNGGSEAIALAALLAGGGVEAEPEFSLHPRSDAGPRWRSNPHNPTGRLAGAGDVADVWDEAFYQLATGAWTRGDLHNGAVVVGSLTKLFACPGLRIGYLASLDDSLIARARSLQPRWSLNGLAAGVLPDLLACADLAAWAASIAGLRRELCDLLTGHGFEVDAADACWVLVHNAAGLRDRLAPHGVLVRDCASFGYPATARIAVPGPDGLARLEGALCRITG